MTEYTNLFSLNNFKKNDDMILKYFMDNTWYVLNGITLFKVHKKYWKHKSKNFEY